MIRAHQMTSHGGLFTNWRETLTSTSKKILYRYFEKTKSATCKKDQNSEGNSNHYLALCPGNEAHSGIQKSHVNASHEGAWIFYNWIYILLCGKQKYPAILYSVFNKIFERDQRGWLKRRQHPNKGQVCVVTTEIKVRRYPELPP